MFKRMSGFNKLEYRSLSEKESEQESLDFLERMRRRRSVRHFSDRPVELAVIENCVRTAATAPSGANQQPWHFVIVGDPETKKAIRLAAEKEEKEFYEGRAPVQWLEKLEKFGTNAEKEYLEIAPYLVVLFSQIYGLGSDGSKEKHYYVSESVGIAAGMFITAVHNAGLVTLTHTPSPMAFLGDILDRPRNERPFLLLPVGYPSEHAMVPAIEKKSDDEVMTVIE